MIQMHVWAIVGLLSGLICCSCGDASLFQDKPSAVVKKMYMACNTGEYSTAAGFLTAATKKFVNDMAVVEGGMKGACDQGSRRGTITSIELKSESIRTLGATVVVDIHFKDSSVKKNDTNELIEDNGIWKVTQAPGSE